MRKKKEIEMFEKTGDDHMCSKKKRVVIENEKENIDKLYEELRSAESKSRMKKKVLELEMKV